MADDRDESQQTEQPSQKRLDDARAKGDLVRSQEVSTFILLAGATLAIAIFARSASEGFARQFRFFLEQPDQIAVDPGGIMLLYRATLFHCLMLFGPAFGVLVIAALAAHLVQNPPAFAPDRLLPDLSKVSPMAGFKRLFGVEGLITMAKGLIKIVIVGAVSWFTLWPMRMRLESLLDAAPASIGSEMMHLVMRLLIAVLAVMAALAVLDYAIQYFRFIQRHRMTKQEVKDEHRQSDGDPAVKARIRKLRVERARKRMIAQVPKATVVIMNPTHYAVALQYESGKTPAPICLAKGVDALALRIRAVAEEHGVPIVENPPLARALYATVEVDEAISAEHYKAVAEVIGYVMRLTGLRSG